LKRRSLQSEIKERKKIKIYEKNHTTMTSLPAKIEEE
jgi:hypothetical protein